MNRERKIKMESEQEQKKAYVCFVASEIDFFFFFFVETWMRRKRIVSYNDSLVQW